MTAPDRVEVRAHAKVNLLLRVLAREESGYHGIETVFALLDTHDRLTAERIERGIELEVTGADTGPIEDNLAYRAAAQALRASGASFGVRLHLTKSIPVRAGMGGGSSDAAASLKAVNQLADQIIPTHELFQLAAGLGADVPFFVSGARMAIGWNRGERLVRLPPPPAAPCLVAVPKVGISTPEAYRLLDEGRDYKTPRATVMFDIEGFKRWGNIARLGGNDFEHIVFGREPAVRTLFERMAETNPLLVRMTGSGSAIFALYRREQDLEDAALIIGARDQTLIKTKTL